MRLSPALPFLLIALTIPVFPVGAQTPGTLSSGAQSADVLPPLYAAAEDADLSADVAARLADLAQAPVPADAELAVLFEHRVMQFTMEGLQTHLDGAVAVRPGHDGNLAYTVPLPWGAESVEASAWLRRADGAVTRLDDAALVRESDPVSDRPLLVLNVPDARPGDVAGWSASFRSKNIVSRALHPSRDHYVAESVYRLIAPEMLSFDMVIANPTPGAQVQPLASAHGRPNDQSARFLRLPPLSEAPFARPDVLRPTLLVTAVGNYVEQLSRWLVLETWDPFAQYIDGTIQAYTTDIPVTASVARKAVGDDDADRIKLLKLQRVISRQLTTIPATDFGNPSESADEVLARQAATPRTKTLLLLAMAREVGLDVDLVLARDNRLGPLDDAHPSLAQFTDVLVRLNGEAPLYLTHDDRYPAGALPHHLLGAPAAVGAPGAMQRVQQAFMKMAMNNQAKPDFGAEPLLTRFLLPGDPDAEPLFQLTELLAWNDDGSAEARLEAVGETDLLLAYRARTPAADLLRDHLAAAYPRLALTPGKTVAGKPKSAVTPMHLVVKGPVTGEADVPAPDGDAWVLPAAAVFGAPTADGWPTGPEAPFFVAGRQTTERTWSHPLPDGWKNVRTPEALILKNDVLDYRAEVSVADGRVTVTRTATFQPCDLDADRTGSVRALLEKARAFETAPLRLEKE